jgi:MFS family permease
MTDKGYLRRIYWRLAGVIMACVVLSLVAVSYFSHRVFERTLVPEVEKKATTVGASVRSLVLKATGYGLTLDSLYGVEQTFDKVVNDNPEFDYAALTDTKGKILFQRGEAPAAAMREYVMSPRVLSLVQEPDRPLESTRVGPLYMVPLPILSADNQPLGILHIGIDSKFVDRVLLEGFLDIVVVLVVSLFFTLELLNFMAGVRLAAGLSEFQHMVERLRAGDFTVVKHVRANDEIGRLLARVDSAIEQINARYRTLNEELRERLLLANDVVTERLRPASERFEALKQRFRFGTVNAPPVADETNLNRIRAPLFAFIVAEELTRSYLPSYVNELLVPIPGLSPQVVIGLPIMLFMLIVALGQPYLGGWSERVGRRTAMLVGAAVATIGFGASALAFNLYDFLLWRSLCALGYAMVFVAAQGYVLDRTEGTNRAQGFALFIGAIMVATVCGPSIGGILADNIGYRWSFAVSAVMALISIMAIWKLPTEEVRQHDHRGSRAPTMKEILALVTNGRFMTLTGLAAMPAKIILTGMCFYLIPLYIVSIGNTQAMSGRLLMVYAVMMVLIVPLSAGFSDASMKRERYVSAGLILSGLSGLLMLISTPENSILILFAVVVVFGLGQALSIAAQSALVGEHCREEIAHYGDDAVYGVYRLLERLGNALGPLAASLLVVDYGYIGAFVALSAFVLVCGLLFTLATRGIGRLQPAAA